METNKQRLDEIRGCENLAVGVFSTGHNSLSSTCYIITSSTWSLSHATWKVQGKEKGGFRQRKTAKSLSNSFVGACLLFSELNFL